MQQYPYSGSDDEHQEAEVAGEPSSIIQAPGENTLRKNFQVLQEQNKAMQQAQLEKQQAEQRAHHHHQGPAPANGAKHAQPGPAHGLLQQPEKKERRRDSRKEDQPPPEPGPPARPYLPPRLAPTDGGSPNTNNTPPGPPPQRPLPPPPSGQSPDLPMGAVRREDGRKPSTPPNRDRNSRLIQQEQVRQNQQRKPEDLDVIAAQLNELAASPRSNRQGGAGDRRSGGQRQSSVEDSRRIGANQPTSASNGQGKTFVGQPQPHASVLDEDDIGTSR